MRPAPLFGNIRKASLCTLLAFLGTHLLLKAWFFSRGFLSLVADPVYDATGGLITHSATAGTIEAVVLLSFLLLLMQMRPGDFGLQRSKFVNGMVVTLFVWSFAQALSVLIGRLDSGSLLFGQAWPLSSGPFWAGMFEAQAGTALIEEIVYRGFLLPQVFLAAYALKARPTMNLIATAAVLSQSYFALMHIPAALRTGLGGTEFFLYLTQVLLVGLLFAAIYMRTGNLFVAVGIHGLLNFPGALFESRVDPSFLVLVLACVLVIVWPYLNRPLGDVFTLRPEFANSLRAAAS